MTLVALVTYVLAVLIAAWLLMSTMPAFWRELFQNRIFRLAMELEDHLDKGELPPHPYVLELREAAYHFAKHPDVACLQNAFRAYKAVQEGTIRPEYAARDAFMNTRPQAEQYIANQIEARLGDLVINSCFRNSILWLPFAVILPIWKRASLHTWVATPAAMAGVVGH